MAVGKGTPNPDEVQTSGWNGFGQTVETMAPMIKAMSHRRFLESDITKWLRDGHGGIRARGFGSGRGIQDG